MYRRDYPRLSLQPTSDRYCGYNTCFDKSLGQYAQGDMILSRQRARNRSRYHHSQNNYEDSNSRSVNSVKFYGDSISGQTKESAQEKCTANVSGESKSYSEIKFPKSEICNEQTGMDVKQEKYANSLGESGSHATRKSKCLRYPSDYKNKIIQTCNTNGESNSTCVTNTETDGSGKNKRVWRINYLNQSTRGSKKSTKKKHYRIQEKECKARDNLGIETLCDECKALGRLDNETLCDSCRKNDNLDKETVCDDEEDIDLCLDFEIPKRARKSSNCDVGHEIRAMKNMRKQNKRKQKQYIKECRKQAKEITRKFKLEEKLRRKKAKQNMTMKKREEKREDQELKEARRRKLILMKKQETMKRLQQTTKLKTLEKALRAKCTALQYTEVPLPGCKETC